MTSYASITLEMITSAQLGCQMSMADIIDAMGPLIESMIFTSLTSYASREDRDDMRQEARIAVLTAVMDYDTDSPAALRTYAHRRIQAAIRDCAVRLRPGLTCDPREERRVRSALVAGDGDVDEAFRVLNLGCRPERRMSRGRFDAIVHASSGAERLDAPESGSSDDTPGEALTLADTLPADPYGSDFEAVEARHVVAQIFASPKVSARHEYVMRADFGIGMPVVEPAETARQVGVTPSRLRGIRREAHAAARTAV